MRLGILALAFLATGCNDLPPTAENIASVYHNVAMKALAKEAPGDIKLKDFSIVVYMPDNITSDANDAAVYMCGKIAGRDSNGWRTKEEAVYVGGYVPFTRKAVSASKAEAVDVVLVERIADDFDRRFEEKMFSTRCVGSEFSLTNKETGAPETYTAHVIYL